MMPMKKKKGTNNAPTQSPTRIILAVPLRFTWNCSTMTSSRRVKAASAQFHIMARRHKRSILEIALDGADTVIS